MSIPETSAGKIEIAPDNEEALRARVDPAHLRQRLAIESEGEAPMFGRKGSASSPDDPFAAANLLRRVLRLTGLYQRGQRNAHAIRVSSNHVGIPRLERAFEGFRVLHMTDLHLDADPRFPRILADRIRNLGYDACVLTGDYRFRTTGEITDAMTGLETVREALRGPVYAILGNHDSVRMVPVIEAMDIQVLLNESVSVNRHGQRLHIGGVDDPHFFRADNLTATCNAIAPDAPSILLAHSPEIYRQAAACGFDLLLCGHTHGGQIRLPGGIPLVTNAECPRRFAAGAWRYHAMSGYTSVGAGSSIVDVRFNCPPEVCIHTLHRSV